MTTGNFHDFTRMGSDVGHSDFSISMGWRGILSDCSYFKRTVRSIKSISMVSDDAMVVCMGLLHHSVRLGMIFVVFNHVYSSDKEYLCETKSRTNS